MSELKPCPFCGNEAEPYSNVIFDSLVDIGVRCSSDSCYARVSAFVPVTKYWLKSLSAMSRATVMWNRRAGEEGADE